MSENAFDAQILGDKLSKLNNSQQSIESLSRWCISHRKRAKQIVVTWAKQFSSSQKEKRVSFLYLANDILQNSRKKGNEFANEFWNVLPSAFRQVYESGDEHGKKAISRLVDIWEERKVFGSQGQNLRDEMLGRSPPPVVSNPPPPESNGRSSNPVKLQKKDARSAKFKLAIGDPPEKIVSAFQNVLKDHSKEEMVLKKCETALLELNKVEEDVQSVSSQGNQNVQTLMDDIQQQEESLQQCIGQLESVEASRAALVYQLKETLGEQESKLEVIRCKLQTARVQMERANILRKRLSPDSFSIPQPVPPISTTESTKAADQNISSSQPITAPSQPSFSFAPMVTTEEENKKAAAAAVAAKLTASTSSAQMLTSILSSLVAEEMGSNNSQSLNFTSGLPLAPPEKRPKLENPIANVGNSELGNPGYFTQLQGNQIQAPFVPPVLGSSSNPSVNQYVQSNGMVMGMRPYSYGTNTNTNTLPPPPPPPLPPHNTMGLSMPLAQPLQPAAQPATGGFYRPLGIGFSGQNNHHQHHRHNTSSPAVP